MTRPRQRYRAQAVHFDEESYLSRAYDVNGADAEKMPAFFVGAFSVWIKPLDLDERAEILNQYVTFDGTTINWGGGSFTEFAYVRGGFQCNLELIGDGGGGYFWKNTPTNYNSTTWYHLACCWNTNFAVNQKLMQIWINGVEVGQIPSDSDYTGAMPVYLGDTGGILGTQAAALVIPDGPRSIIDTMSGTRSAVELGDLQLWDGQFIDWSSAPNLAKVIQNGKPVDPAIAAVAFGQPNLLFSGDYTTFPTNQGTGGSFTLTGTLTDASTSPSDD